VQKACAKCFTAFAVTLVAGLGLWLGTAGAVQPRCDGAAAAAVRLRLSTARSAVDCLINKQRVDHGLPALRHSSRLSQAAQHWSDTLVTIDAFTHGNFAGRILAAGVNFRFAGENIGTGQATPSQIVSAWMASTDHCRNILDPDFSELGLGMSAHPVIGFATGPATWTADFALPFGHRPPARNWAPANGCPY
jgi:uncharacterized protein YkwD